MILDNQGGGELSPLANLEAEMAVLGSIFWAMSLKRVEGALEPSDFWSPAHATIFKAMMELHKKGSKIDLVILQDFLGKHRVEEVGGWDYLAQCMESVPTASNLLFYAEIVKNRAKRRRLHKWFSDGAKLAQNPDKSDEEIFAYSTSMPKEAATKAVLIRHVADVEVGDGGDRGIPTGIEALDSTISTGGAPLGQISAVRAYHKTGKSCALIQFAMSAAEADLHVVYATFADLSAQQVKRRMLKNLCGFMTRPSNLIDNENFDLANITLNCYNLEIYDASQSDETESGNTVEAFVSWVSALHSEKKIGLICCDYWQEVMSTNMRFNEIERLNHTASVLRRLAGRLGCPIYVGSQVTEGNTKSGSKTITKGSRKLEEVAGWVITIEQADSPGDFHIENTFSRFGGDGGSVLCKFDKKHLRFVEKK